MKALIMAAGIGSRISRHLNGQPKCCVKIGDVELIKYTFDLLNKKGITNIAIVTGYNEHFILDALSKFKFKHFKNNFYDVTNSIASLWFAKEFLDGSDDVLIMNGDVFMEDKVLDVILSDYRSPLFLSDSSRIEDADYRFNWKDEKLVKFGKELSNDETTGEYVGIAKIAKEDIAFTQKSLKKLIETQKHNYWWEDIFYRNIDKKSIYITDIKGMFWAEVDYIEDYERIQEYLKQKGGGNG
jgi:choline kinase